MSRLMAAVLQPFRFIGQNLHSSVTQATTSSSLVKPETFSLNLIRTKIRCYFPRPNEVKRVRRHGWQSRISTHNGRKTIMRRLLKGKFVLTH